MAAPMSSDGIVTVSYKTYRDTYRNTYQISQYVSFVEKVYRYTPTHNYSGIGNDRTSSCTCNYHTIMIMTTTALRQEEASYRGKKNNKIA